jgi:hypothetical protein
LSRSGSRRGGRPPELTAWQDRAAGRGVAVDVERRGARAGPLLELRDAAQKQLGDRFDALRFHDAILAQGLLPPDLMRKAVLAELH